jgi:thioredoxin reductase (NADPH)
VTARTAILATGISDIHPLVPNLEDIRELGLLRYCPICDAYDYRDQVVVVLAQDDAGLEKALFIRHYTPKLRVVVPAKLRIGARRVHQLREARVRVDRGELVALEPSRSPYGLIVHLDTGKQIYSRVTYPMLGCEVKDSAFRSLRGLHRTKEGFLVFTTEQRLSIPGLFGVGDCLNQVGQLSIAAGQAAIAATTIHNDLL